MWDGTDLPAQEPDSFCRDLLHRVVRFYTANASFYLYCITRGPTPGCAGCSHPATGHAPPPRRSGQLLPADLLTAMRWLRS